MYELIYTSTSQGLLAGRSGFCTVAMTAGFPPNLIPVIENMSGYKTLYAPGDSNAGRNPVNYSCQHFVSGATRYIVVSKISFAGLSYTGRTNILAHHLLFTADELAGIPGGAVSILRESSNFPPWEGEPRVLPQKKVQSLKAAPMFSNSASNWEKFTGDSRFCKWAASRFKKTGDKAAILAFDPLKISGEDILELIAETASLLTTEELLSFTFCTYCSNSPVGSPPALRAYPLGLPLLDSIRRMEPESVIELGKLNPLPPEAWNIDHPAEPAGTAGSPPPPPIQKPAAAEPHKAVNIPPPRPAKQPRQIKEKPPAGKLPFLIVTVAVSVLLIAGIAWRMLHTSQKHSSETDVAEGVRVLDAGRTLSIHKAEQKVQKALPAFQVTETAPAAAAVEKKVTFGELTEDELFELHLAFRSLNRFALPASLAGTAALEVTLNGIGELTPAGVERFIRGNNSRLITVLAAGEQRGDLGTVIVPDQNAGGELILRLHSDFIDMQIPPLNRLYPRLKNISSIRFSSSDGKHYLFEPQILDDAVTTKLNAVWGEVKVKCDRNILSFTLQISEKLWVMRDYFELQVDGRPLGGAGITEKTVPLKQLNFTQADRLISRRNSQLRDYNSSKKRLEKFESRNRAKLTKPETDAHLTEEYGDKLEELKKAMADNAHDLSGIISKLEDGKENWRLRELNKRWMGWLEKQREFNKYRQDVNDAEAKYVKHNEELKQHFEVLYPPLLQHFSRELAGGFMIDIDLFRSNSVQSLDKTVKVEVIRRKTDGVR